MADVALGVFLLEDPEVVRTGPRALPGAAPSIDGRAHGTDGSNTTSPLRVVACRSVGSPAS